MTRSSRNRLGRALPGLLLIVPVALVAGCGGGDDDETGSAASSSSSPASDPSDPSDPSEDADADTRSVSAAGVSFDVPAGYTDLDAESVADGGLNDDVVADLADRMGIEPDQLQQMISQVDLLLFSDEGAHQGFLDNINVTAQPGALPSVDGVRRQLLQLGADIDQVEVVETGLGDAVVADYRLDLGFATVTGRGVAVPTDEGIANVVVTAIDPELVDDLGDRIVATLGSD